MEATGCRLVTYTKEDAEFSIYGVADLHYLNRGMAKELLIKDVQRIKRDIYAMWILYGDYADWISPNDKRFDPEAFDESFKVNDLTRLSVLTLKGLLSFLEPIKSTCLAAGIGNHEYTYMVRNNQMFIHDQLCEALGVPNIGYSGWVDLYFIYDPKAEKKVSMVKGDKPDKFTARLRVFVHHGMGAANTAGGKINKLKQLVDMTDSDLVMSGHVHEQFAKAFVRLRPNEDCSEIGQKITMGLITGSYLRGYSPGYTPYSEIKAFFPTTMGASRARYKPETMELTVENRADGVGLRG